MNESKIAEIMAKLNAVYNQLVEVVDYVSSRGFPNQRFDHQQGYRGSYGNGPTSYTQNSQFQQPLQNSNSFSFRRNYDLASYQAPPPPPTPKSKIESLLEQILEGQQRILERPIPRWNESSLTTSRHSTSMESEYELVKIEESDDFAVAEAVSIDTIAYIRDIRL